MPSPFPSRDSLSAAERGDRRRWLVLLAMGVGGNLLLVWEYSHSIYATVVAAIAATVAFAFGRATNADETQ